MMYLPGLDSLTNFINKKKATHSREIFIKKIFAKELEFEIENELQKLKYNVCSFSSKSDFADQFLSILSFLVNVGTPQCWYLYSDGTHDQLQEDLISAYFPFVKFQKSDFNSKMKNFISNNKLDIDIWGKLLDHVLGKKFLSIVDIDLQMPSIYMDTDIVFYPQAGAYLRQAINENHNGYFLPDINNQCLDNEVDENYKIMNYSVNSGLIIFSKKFKNFTNATNFLSKIKTPFSWFFEQTLFHILAHDHNFYPLDPRKFIITTSDQFKKGIDLDKSTTALRHYTGPTRHKMWQNGWRWHLDK